MHRIVECGDRVLAFGAHPDDLEVGAGGLIARLAAAGTSVTMVVGSVPNRLAERIAEARAGAALLGAELVLLDERGTRLEEIPMHELVAQLDRLVAAHAPDLVITHSTNDLHWDHCLIARATVSALRRAPCDLVTYLAGPDLGVQGRTLGQCFADITTTIEVKLAAIAAHASQAIDLESRRDGARAAGRLAGVEYAEVFEVLRLRI